MSTVTPRPEQRTLQAVTSRLMHVIEDDEIDNGVRIDFDFADVQWLCEVATEVLETLQRIKHTKESDTTPHLSWLARVAVDSATGFELLTDLK